MYQPPHFREDDLSTQHALIRAHPLGLLVTSGPSGLVANPVPFVLDATSGLGTLKCHVARANPQWKEADPAQEALVIFRGADSYITPSWYEEKRKTGKVVPTWNYAMVQAYGRPVVRDDRVWLARQIAELTTQMEQARPAPWAVGDAPPDFVAAQLKGIVGIEIPIGRIEGKWKVSQNRPAPDRAGVVEGLRGENSEAAAAMAALVSERSPAR